METVLEENTLCVQNNKQDFLVSVTIYKARHLQEFNCDTFIMISCNGKYKRTRVAYRTDNPYFHEYFCFSLNCTERKLRRKGITFFLYRPSVCTTMHSCIGEFHVDLNTVWEQNNHGFFKKWAMFEPAGRAPSNQLHCGYLLIDVSIACATETPSPIKLNFEEDYEVIERNRLLPTLDANDEIRRVRYCCNIYRGEFVNGAEYAVRVSYGGLKVRTKPSSYGRSFRWNEKLCFVGTHPSPNQIFAIDLLTTNCCYINVKSAKDIPFSSLAKRTNDVYDLPTFGPAWVQFYSGNQGSQYVGKLLISISTEVLSIESVPAHKIQTLRMYEPLVESNYWEEQKFVIRFTIIRLQLFRQLPLRRILVYLSCADIHSNAITFPLDNLKPSCRSQSACVDGATKAFFTIKVQLPDYRHKYFIPQVLFKLCDRAIQLKDLFKGAGLNSKEKNAFLSKRKLFIGLLEQLESDFMRAHEKIAESTYKQHTKLDQVRKSHILQQLLSKKSELLVLKTSLNDSTNFDEVSHVILELENIVNHLSKLTHDEQNQHPDILLHMSRPGHSSVDAIARFNMLHYLHQPSPLGSSSGLHCGKRCTILARSIQCNHTCPDRCGCIYAKLDYELQIATEQQELITQNELLATDDPSRKVADVQLPIDNHLTLKYVHCKVHVYQGRIFAGFDDTEQFKAKLTVLFENYERALSIIPNTWSPCWNETVEFLNVPFTMSSTANNDLGQKCTIMFILQCKERETERNAIGWLDTSIQLLETEQRIIPERANTGKQRNSSKFNSNESNADPLAIPSFLHWVPLFLKGIKIAEILVSSNTLEVSSLAENDGSTETERLLVHGLPPEISPSLSTYRIRALFVGLRRMHQHSCRKMKKSRILIILGDASIMSGLSGTAYGSSANFAEGYENCSVRLPVNPHYWPLMILKHIDCTDDKRMKTIGNAIVNASDLLVDRSTTSESSAENSTIIEMAQDENVTQIPMNIANQNPLNIATHWSYARDVIKKQVESLNAARKSSKSLSSENLELTWWTKFYNCQLSQKYQNYSLKIYDKELESVPEFNGLKDWSASYMLQKVKRSKKSAHVKHVYGAVKCQIQIVSLVNTQKQQTIPLDRQMSPISNLLEIVVIVYVVQALNLTSRDIMSESDAYIVLSYGNQRVRDRAFYIPNQASPVFGRRFEMRGMLPRDQILQLSVYDRDFVSSDDLIGSTTIDIEDRFRSKHLPSFGLPNYYSSRGYNKWRHQWKPSEMLLNLCKQHGIERPHIKGGKITVGGQEFEADVLRDAKECQTEQLCLLALNNFKHVANGFPLTPEHVETRSLYHPQRGGIEQGKVQLWIELYEPNQPHPLPLDITPQPPKPYELRLIVWNTADVMLNERNIFGTEMSDIYVKCWLQEFTEAQYTDVHYRSLTGEGNFNWRMVFPFRFSPADGMVGTVSAINSRHRTLTCSARSLPTDGWGELLPLVVRRRKAFYEQYDTELKYPPVLTVQIWDNDAFSADDFLGTMELNLTQLPVPASSADACKLSEGLSLTGSGSSTGGSLNLFTQRRIRGWFAVHGNNMSSIDASDRHGGVSLTGKIELELEILNHEDATQNPVGVGRKPPQHLPEPLRPEVSFNWLRQPAKTFNKLLWPRVRKSFIWFGAVVLLCLLIYGLVVNVPTVFMVRSLEQRRSFESISSEG